MVIDQLKYEGSRRRANVLMVDILLQMFWLKRLLKVVSRGKAKSFNKVFLGLHK